MKDRGKRGVQPQELTSLLDKRMIVAIRKAFVEKTKQLELEGEDVDGTYASLEVDEFMELLSESNVIPADVVDKITQFIDVNDDGDIEFDEFINFVLAAESNLEFSKKAGMEKFNISVSKNLSDDRGDGMENIDTLCYTSQPQSMIIGGGVGGEVRLFNSMTFKLVDTFLYESKAKSMNKSLMVGIRPEDQPMLKARIKEKTGASGGAAGKVQLVSSCVLPNAPHMLVMGAADSSICVFDLTTQSSRMMGAVGRVDSLSAPAVCLLAVADKTRHYGESSDGGPPSPGGGLDAGASSVIGGSSISSGAVSPRVKKRNSFLNTVSEAGTVPSSSGGSSSDDDMAEETPPQTVYMGTAEGTLYWLTLDASFGVNSAKNKRLFEESQLRAAGKQTADIVVEVDTKYKTHAQKAQEIATFSKYRLEEKEGLIMPWQRAKMMREKEAKAAKEAKEELDKYRNLPLPCVKLHNESITRSLYVQEIDCVLCASLDGTISFFSHETKTHTRTFLGTHREAATNGILALSYSSKNRFVVSSADRALFVWELYTEEITHRMNDLPAIVTNAQTFDKQDIIVALLSNNSVYVWSALNFDLRQVLDGCGPPSAYGGDMPLGRDDDVLRHLLVFENLEIARVEAERASELAKARALVNPALAQKSRNKAERKAADHPCSLCLGGDVLSLWRFSARGEDEDASREIHKQPEDIVTVLFNTNFNLFIALYSLGTAKVFSVLSGASLREFTVCETDAFGNIKADLLQRDPTTGLLLPVIKDACFDCTQRRLLVVTRDDAMKVFNFFAGVEIDDLEPSLPHLALPVPAVPVTVTAGAGAGGDSAVGQSEGGDQVESHNRPRKDKSKDGDGGEDDEERRGRAQESISTCMMIEMSGIEKPGREKFSRRLLFLGGSGASVSTFLDRGETIDEHPCHLFKWSKRPIDYASRMLSLSVGLGPGSESLSVMSGDGAGGGATAEGAMTTMGAKEQTRVLWNVYMDFKSNNHCNAMAAGPGNGMSSGREKGSFLVVGYSNGTCICFNANSVSVVSRPDPAAVGTVLHGMKLKLNAGDDASAGSNAGKSDKDKGKDEMPPRLARLQSVESHYEGSAISAAKPTTTTIDCAVALYTPQICVLVGACSDRYLKFWNSDTGQILCSVSYIHGDPGGGEGRGGSLYSAASGGGAGREDEERIKVLKIKHNPATDSYALVAGYDSGTVRVWELIPDHLHHLQEQLDVVQREAEEQERLEDELAREEAAAEEGEEEVRGASPVGGALPGMLSDDVAGAELHEATDYEGVTAPTRARDSDFTSFKHGAAGTGASSRADAAEEDPAEMRKGGDLDEGALGLGVCPVTLCEEFVAHSTSIFSVSILHLDSSDIEAASTSISEKEDEEDEEDEEGQRADADAGTGGSSTRPQPPSGTTRASGGRGMSRRDRLKAQHEAVKRPDPKDYRNNPFRTEGTWRDLFKKDASAHVRVADNKFARDHYLVTATLAGECMFWTLHGVFIGQFGGKMANKWDLAKPSSWPNRWLINNDNEGDEDAGKDRENARKKNAKESRPTLSVMSTLEAEVARAFKGAKPSRRQTSEELNAEVEKHLRETQSQPPVSQEHSRKYHKMIMKHPVVDTASLSFSSTRVSRMDV